MAELELTEDISPTIVKKSEIDTKAEEIKTRSALPKKPGDKVSFDVMCEWLKLLDTEEKKSRVLLYVYRLEPVISRQLVDPQANNSIDVISDGFDRLTEDYFTNTHGGGKYKIIVFDAGNKELQRNGFFSATLNLPMLDCPPKLDLREVVWSDSKNKGYQAWARGQRLIDENNMATIEKKGTESNSNSSDAMVQAMKLAMDFASKMDEKQQAQLKRQLGAEDTLGKSIGDILLEKMKQEDPNKQLTTLTTLISAMKSMQPEPTKTENTMVPLLTMIMESSKQQFALMMENSKNQMTMIMEMMKSGKSETTEVDDTTRLKNLLEIARMMKGGPGTVEPKSTAEVVMETIGQVAPSVFNVISNIMAANAASKGVAGFTPAPNVPNGSVTQANPTPQPQVVQPAGLPQPMTLSEKQSKLQQFAPLLGTWLSKEGWEFATWITEGFPGGDGIVASIIKDGADDLLNTLKSLPEVWNPILQTYGEPHMVKWIGSFCNYKEELNKLETEENRDSD